ncbi:hypothetical protein GGR50DRAFT_119451 [Xylaria sp. CBS 124048]|nr:hypothetical protein GGR50DRAFT_119451 [Xylaria sp. CBS 124048]
MDNNPSAQQQYSSNQLATSGSSYPSPSAVAPHQLQQGSATQHTLPPLQHNNSMQPIYGSHPHTPRTPGTPSTPQPQNSMSNYPPPNAGPGRGSYPMMPNQYQNQPQGYPTTTSMMPQTSVAVSHPQPIAPAPPPAARPPVLRPMPAGGVIPQSGLSSPYTGSPMMGHQPSLGQETEPTHVVGSQGRRGILPSAPGRPAAPTGTGASKNTVIPQKDADGKFPCPHCTKTYLHAKHLKRHLLRHTGDRPYMCVLCRDTFSRSDILKRHFQKCSIRRGNPTGASHLSHPQAHVKKQQQNAQKANEGDLGHINGMANMPGDGVVHPFGMVQIQDGMGNMANDQSQISRSSSMSRMDDAANRDRRNMPAGYNGEVSNSMSSNINPQLANFNLPPNQNGGLPIYGASGSNQQSGLDWSQMFQQPGAQPTHTYNATFPSPNIGQNQTAIKTDPNLAPERSHGALGIPPTDDTDRPLFISNWEPQTSMQDGCRQLSTQIINLFYPSGSYVRPENNAVHHFFHPENIKIFLQSFVHFHIHFSFLHIPTFRIMEAYPGLTAAICCIGACYSNRANPPLVREVTTLLDTTLQRDCALTESQNLFKIESGKDKIGLEKLQALILVTFLLTWNGTASQRETAQRLFPVVASIVRNSGLLQIQKESKHSRLHHPDVDLRKPLSQSFDWEVWVEQEKRIRLMHSAYVLDVARGLFFNLDPQFDAFEITIPLPADDAAFEAPSGEECAGALNLFGSDTVKKANPHGSQRSKQPELHLIIRAMLDGFIQIQPSSTNIWGKNIIIHAIIALIRRAQVEGHLTGLSGSTTPLRRNDWVVTGGPDTGDIHASAVNSGVDTAVSGTQPMPPELHTSFSSALEKWKSYWEMDMAIQYPRSVVSPLRYGYSRAPPQLFWLAKMFLRTPRLNVDLMGPDQRLMQVLQLLRAATAGAEQDDASRGEEPDTAGVMIPDHAVPNLTLELTQFFKPPSSVTESPRATSVET